MNNGRNVLIYLAVIYKGDYDSIISALRSDVNPDYQDVERVCKELDCKTLTMLDPDYPVYLKHHPRSPIVLFYYGDISLIDDYHYKYNLGIVGTRHPTEYGLIHTTRLVYEVANDCTIISGLAKGIDAQAHQAALDARGKTVAVLGSGIDTPYPSENIELYHNIINNGGLVVSEYPPKVFPEQHHFPCRNRLIAMFSSALLVTQAMGTKTGTSITVGFMLSYGKQVMCIPYPVEEIDSFCNQLIFEGASLVRDGHDILIDMNIEKIKLLDESLNNRFI